MSSTFLYRCPVTGYNVQGFVADNPAEKNGQIDQQVYEPVTCVVCRRIHLVDPKTGKVAGSNDK